VPDTEYAFLSAYLKGEESKIANVSQLYSMSHAARIQDLLAAIVDTDIGSFLDRVPIKTFSDVDRYLWIYLDDCLQRLQMFSGVPDDVLALNRAYVSKYDIHNIKSALKHIYLNQDIALVPIGVFKWNDVLDELEKAEDKETIAEIANNCGFQEYAGVLRNICSDPGTRDIFIAEHELDDAYHIKLSGTAEKILEGELLKRVFGIIVDMINLGVAFRSSFGLNLKGLNPFLSCGYLISVKLATELSSAKKEEFSEKLEVLQYKKIADEIISAYGVENSTLVIDRVIEQNRFRILSELLSPRIMSPLVDAWYLIIKESELRDVRIVSKAIFDGIPVDEVKEYLVAVS
jgi:vacuolar-type H+-ATPase subunit C/Vma6